MSLITKLYLAVGLAAALVGGFFLLKWNYDNNRRMEGRLEILGEQLRRRDSVIMTTVKTLGSRVDTAITKVTPAIDRWHTTVIKDTIRLPGSTTSTIVFRDTAFQRLPDSVKVDTLIARGERLNKMCTDLRNSCQIFKDSAFEAFRIKDSIIQVSRTVFNLKKSRHCSPGLSIGGIGGLMKSKPDSADKRTWRPAWGIGGALGMSCIL